MDKEMIVEKLATHDERIRNLEMWQKRQNGSLQRIEGKIDRFSWWLVLTLGSMLATCIAIILKVK